VLLTQGEERQSERAWVFRIARNLRLDRWRAAGRAPATQQLTEDRVVTMAAARLDALAIEPGGTAGR